MRIFVPVKQVPDLVEELEVDASGTDLDRQWLTYKLNEFDDHALEEALLLKEEAGGEVVVAALDSDVADDILYTALAKGADRALKIPAGDGPASSHAVARIMAEVARSVEADIILTGVQAADDLHGQNGPLIAGYLDLPHVSVVTSVRPSGQAVEVHQEYAGGLTARIEVDLPAVLGIQAARQSPRYVPVSRVRQAMKEGRIDSLAAAGGADGSVPAVRRVFKPESAGRAEMIDGSTQVVVDRLLEILNERGLVRA
ncbi:MAG: electron transfer flavoprotein subunit beta/FixA family protein [Chloroflexota bacterium]|nr:electron transfer flavoprotein subunit beta/FixA family protein [Chloroflexota bacterium]